MVNVIKNMNKKEKIEYTCSKCKKKCGQVNMFGKKWLCFECWLKRHDKPEETDTENNSDILPG
jgi:hypothetical protein